MQALHIRIPRVKRSGGTVRDLSPHPERPCKSFGLFLLKKAKDLYAKCIMHNAKLWESKKDNIIETKSFDFAVRIVNLYKY